MSNRTLTVALCVSLAATVACDKQEKPEPTTAEESAEATEEQGAEQAPDKEAEPTDEQAKPHPAVSEDSPFAKYGLSDLAEQWQGSWVVPSTLSSSAVWKVEGAKVTTMQGDQEKTLDFEVTAPCQLRLTEKTEGGSSSTFKTFAVGDTEVFAGLGSAGTLADAGAVVCAGGKIYELTNDGCVEWKERFGKWERQEADCSLEEGTFQAGSRKLETVGGALVDAQMKNNVAKRYDSLDKAKAALSK